MKQLVIGIIIALIAVIFAIQNSNEVLVKLFLFEKEVSLALLLLVTLIMGIATGLLVSVPGIMRRNKEIKTLKSENKQRVSSVK